ncbi:hypothetical protein CHUAL_012983 [Chamberlinius hualienensis]
MSDKLCISIPKQTNSAMLMDENDFDDAFVESAFDPFGQSPLRANNFPKRRTRSTSIVDSLLFEIYDKLNFGRRFSEDSDACSTMSESFGGFTTVSPLLLHYCESELACTCKLGHQQTPIDKCDLSPGRRLRFKKSNLDTKGLLELKQIAYQYKRSVNQVANELVRQLKKRDRWMYKRNRNYDVITAVLQASSLKRSEDARMRFSVEPFPGDNGYDQWHDAMRMVVRLTGGIPIEFRKRIWLTMANKHFQHNRIDWSRIKRICFNDRSNPDDNELGVQIVKDLHRTGCSLFCGSNAEHNQALLKRVLLAYARFNKTVGYCQGFNMLAALILEVVEWKEEDALKIMIYLIEGVLPESYFANNLRGLSVDMAVFRDLLRIRFPTLSTHLDNLQMQAKDSISGTIYEPPLTNVFTIQWFLTIFTNCLPKSSVFRVWDLMFLEGNEILLRTALTIWDALTPHIMTVECADEFYSVMGTLTRETLEFGVINENNLVKTVCTLAPFPYPQLSELRDKYTYNITPFNTVVVPTDITKKSAQLLYSDDEDEDNEQMKMAAWCFVTAFPPQLSISNKAAAGGTTGHGLSPSSSGTNFSSIGPGAYGYNINHTSDQLNKSAPSPERMSLDISMLKKQYTKLRERQKQARVIFRASIKQPNDDNGRTAQVKPRTAVNHLLLGKKPLTTRRYRNSTESNDSHSSVSANSTLTFKLKPLGNEKNQKKIKKSKETSKKINDLCRRHSMPSIFNAKTIPPEKDISKKELQSITNDKKDQLLTVSDIDNKSSVISVKQVNGNRQSHVVERETPSLIVHSDSFTNEKAELNDADNILLESQHGSRCIKTENQNLTSKNGTDENGNTDMSKKKKTFLTRLEVCRKSLKHLELESKDQPCSSSDEFYSVSSDQSQSEDEKDPNDYYQSPVNVQLGNSASPDDLRTSNIPDLHNNNIPEKHYLKMHAFSTASRYATSTKETLPTKTEVTHATSSKPQKPSFNPFPVTRRSSIISKSKIGIKLGLYDSRVQSFQAKKYDSNFVHN